MQNAVVDVRHRPDKKKHNKVQGSRHKTIVLTSSAATHQPTHGLPLQGEVFFFFNPPPPRPSSIRSTQQWGKACHTRPFGAEHAFALLAMVLPNTAATTHPGPCHTNPPCIHLGLGEQTESSRVTPSIKMELEILTLVPILQLLPKMLLLIVTHSAGSKSGPMMQSGPI